VTFWAVGLATPLAIYALDFWEHSLGLACMTWALVLLHDVVEWRAGWRSAVGAGLLFGAAATLRTEALVYLVAATGVAFLVVLLRGRAPRPAMVNSLLVIAGAGVALVVNAAIEHLIVGGDLRTGRAVGTVAGSGSVVAKRVQEALTSSVGIGFGTIRPSADWMIGALVVVLVGAAALALQSSDPRRRRIGIAADVVVLVILAMRFGEGLGFVPGVLVASPLAAAGLFVCWRAPRVRMLAVVACVALPFVWAAQYTGSMWPQWGGRYVLFTGVLLAVAACVVLQSTPRALIATCIVAGLVTAGGLVWLSVRTHVNADGIEHILARDDDVLIAREAHLFREVGAFYTPSRRWLNGATADQLGDAVRVARAAGARELATIAGAGAATPPRIGSYVRSSSELVPFIRPDVRVQVTTYRLR
jgi:hypothetical protein